MPADAAPQPVALADLFDGLGTFGLRYAEPRCSALSGRTVEIEGYLARTHDGSRVMLVDQAGACPDCSPAPTAAVQLPGFELPASVPLDATSRVRGTLSYGFEIDADGCASFLRLVDARVAR